MNGTIVRLAMLLINRLHIAIVRKAATGRHESWPGGGVELAKVRNVLVIRLDQTIGDTVMNSPLLRELKRGLPSARITLVADKNVRDLVQSCPYTERVAYYDRGSSLRWSLALRPWYILRFAWQHLRGRSFDLAIVPRFSEDHHAALLALASGARWRIAFSEQVQPRKAILSAGMDSCYTQVLFSTEETQHEVHRNLECLRRLGVPIVNSKLELWGVDAQQRADVVQATNAELGKRPIWLGLGLSGGNSRLKQWPVSSFVSLARLSTARWGAANVGFVLFGSLADADLSLTFRRELATDDAVIDLTGRTTPTQMGAVMLRLSAFVGNDSGAMHVAAAVGIPVIGIFGSSCHHQFGPWSDLGSTVTLKLSCGPCGQRHVFDRCSVCIYPEPQCLTKMRPELVLDDLSRKLAFIKRNL